MLVQKFGTSLSVVAFGDFAQAPRALVNGFRSYFRAYRLAAVLEFAIKGNDSPAF